MFIPLINETNGEKGTHIALESVTRFYQVPSSEAHSYYYVEADHTTREISKETYDLLKSLVLRP